MSAFFARWAAAACTPSPTESVHLGERSPLTPLFGMLVSMLFAVHTLARTLEKSVIVP